MLGTQNDLCRCFEAVCGSYQRRLLISLIIVIWLMWRYRKWGKDRFLTESLVILVVFIASLITVFLLPTYNDEDVKYGESYPAAG